MGINMYNVHQIKLYTPSAVLQKIKLTSKILSGHQIMILWKMRTESPK
jgi:hypothetical protein